MIFVLIVTIILLVSATVEIIYVNDIISDLKQNVHNLSIKYENENDNITHIYDDVVSAQSNWNSRINFLSFLFNNKDLQCISDTFIRLAENTEQNEINNALTELELLKEYVQNSENSMAFNIQNVLWNNSHKKKSKSNTLNYEVI